MSIKGLILNSLMESAGTFLSGEELSKSLDVSRTAVWKAIKSLRDDGWHIEATNNKGYMLLQNSKALTEESLRLCMPKKYKNIPLHIFDDLDSTNIRARQLAMDGAPHGTVVIAHRQTAGRGRLGRSFYSPQAGVYLTIIIRPDFDMTKSVLITSAAAVAVTEAIEKVCEKCAAIKWVNDVYVDGKKVCGILTEGVTDFETGRIESLVVGIGINTSLKGFPPELLDTVGALEGDYSKSALTATVISNMLDLAETIENKSFIETYRNKSLVIGKTVTVYKGVYRTDPNKELPGRPAKVLNIDENGGLCVIYTDGTRETLTSGEISIRL